MPDQRYLYRPVPPLADADQVAEVKPSGVVVTPDAETETDSAGVGVGVGVGVETVTAALVTHALRALPERARTCA